MNDIRNYRFKHPPKHTSLRVRSAAAKVAVAGIRKRGDTPDPKLVDLAEAVEWLQPDD